LFERVFYEGGVPLGERYRDRALGVTAVVREAIEREGRSSYSEGA